MKARVFRKAEKEVEVLRGLAGSAFDKVIYHADNVEFPSIFTNAQDAFVRVDDHLHIRVGVDDVYKRLGFVIVFIDGDRLIFGKIAVEIN